MKQILFRGAATALVTPMQPDGSLDLETLSRLTEWQIQSSISALVPCGTTGEAATLTDEERFTVIQTVAKTAAGRVPVIAGAGCNDTARAEQNCLAAAAAGADALLLVTPYYNKCTPKGLQSHFARLASATPLPVILYNVPSRTGCISVLSNLLPHSTEALCQAILQNDLPAARSLHYSLLPLMKSLFCEVNPIPVKAAMPLVGFPCGSCRMPLSLIEPDHLALLQQQFTMTKQLGLC